MKNEIYLKPEILSPAGDIECLKTALDFGADAVYLAGKSFGMRTSSQNFDTEQMEQAVKLCHSQNAKIYVTCNIVAHNEEIKLLPEFIKSCANLGIDAFIVSDLGVLSIVKKYAPNVDIHISTQAGVANYETANMFYDLGAKRVVLARELSFEEIKEIRDNTSSDLEIECFVHGAMCVSFSGRCLLSSYLTNRDANRGDCSQPCRWEYELVEKKRPNESFEIVEEQLESGRSATYIMNSKDMCMIEHIPKLIKAGISSLKIEGRAKSQYYVASVSSAYRKALDFSYDNPNEEIPKEILEEVDKISHRQYSTGFYMGDEPGQNVNDGGYIRNWDVIAICESWENGVAKLSQRNKFLLSEEVEVLQPKADLLHLKIEEMKDERGREIDSAPHATMTVYIKSEKEIKAGSYLRRKR